MPDPGGLIIGLASIASLIALWRYSDDLEKIR